MLPNFLIIGAQKSGTTSLCHLLSQHPQVFMSDPKEPMFFSHPDNYAKGMDWYSALFSQVAGETAVGEGSTSYAAMNLHSGTADRIARHLPDAKLIYVVRHPLQRAASAWLHHLAKGRSLPLSFDVAVKTVDHLVDLGRYDYQLSAFRPFYDPHRILVVFFDDFAKDAGGVVRACCEFLGVDVSFENDSTQPLNYSKGQTYDGRVSRSLQAVPLLKRVVRILPEGVRARIAKRLQKRIHEHPVPLPETLDWLDRRIGAETREFLVSQGRSPGLWEFSS